MNCLFCAAKSAPQAKFCSECGSPLSLQICPTCAAVNEKTDSTCLKCGYSFALQHEADVAVVVPQIASLPAGTLANDAVVDAKVHEWEIMLQEIEQEVHRQLEAEQLAPTDSNSLSPAPRTARLATNRVPVRSHSMGYTGRTSETGRTRSRLSGLVVFLTLALLGGAAAPYFLSSSSAKTPPSERANPGPNQIAATLQPASAVRDLPPGDQIDRGDAAAGAGSPTAASGSLTGPQLLPGSADESYDLSSKAEAKSDPVFIPVVVAPPVEVMLDERKQDQTAPPAARKAAPPHRISTKGGEAARVPNSPVEHRVIAEAHALYQAQPAVAESRPCSAGIRALALCDGPSKK